MQNMHLQSGMLQRKKKRNIPLRPSTKNKNERRLQFRSRKRNLQKKDSTQEKPTSQSSKNHKNSLEYKEKQAL